MEGCKGIVTSSVEDGERRLVGFHTAFAFPPGFLAAARLVGFAEEAEQEIEDGHDGGELQCLLLTLLLGGRGEICLHYA